VEVCSCHARVLRFMQTEEVKRKKLFNYLSKASQKAYKDEYLITNDVLCKSETRARILELYLAGKVPDSFSLIKKIFKVIQFYSKNTVWFLLYLSVKLAHFLSNQRYYIPVTKELYALDVFFIVRNIINQKKFNDVYLTGLTDVLDKIGGSYFYVPSWFGSWNPFTLFKIFRILKKNECSVLTEFQILEWSDYIRVPFYLLAYPFHVWRFISELGNLKEDRLLSFCLWETLDTVTLKNYLRYFIGKRVSCLKGPEIKCISWYENQARDKTFIRGLRYVPEKVEIFGAQLFLRTPNVLNIIPDESEIPFGVLPDKVLVNGPSYDLGLKSTLEEVGPSLRYWKLFQVKADPAKGNIILVLLPYWESSINNILNLIKQIDWPAEIVIKFHPAVEQNKYTSQIPSMFTVTDKDLYSLFGIARMVIGQSTGTMVEAASLGIPVIDIVDPEKFSHSFMPECGREVLWDKATHVEDLYRHMRQFEDSIRLDPSQLLVMGEKIRDNYFCKPTEEQIVRAFDLT
jgi:hypothetical protein